MNDLLTQLQYPTDPGLVLRKRNTIRKLLLETGEKRVQKKIAILGGSTTHDIREILDLFLLYNGIEATFYECEYNQYYEEVMFNNEELKSFRPDIVWFHTSYRNILHAPDVRDTREEVEAKYEAEIGRFRGMWEKCAAELRCTIIQNNFEYPFYRLLGNKDASDIHGLTNFIQRLNAAFYEYSRSHENFHIHDLNYVAADYGLSRWHDLSAWYLYKYCCRIEAIPCLAHSVARIIKSLYGKNKKGFVLDLDNTLWGGVVGDDGVQNLEIGSETAAAQAYQEFQQYLKAHQGLGVLLNINSKNDRENALAGLAHPEGILREEDFITIKANWNPKSQNMVEIAQELNLLPESLVFVDDNPAEREIVSTQVPHACVAPISCPENYIREIDRAGFFEVTSLSQDDLARTQMYKANAQRVQAAQSFGNYEDYLRSLDMKAEIKPFSAVYMARIAQLTNKSNQFNLTTKRYTQAEIEAVAADLKCITLYGKLTDKFGDNGVVSVMIGRQEKETLHIELFLMSCRVLKRGMEQAMMDELVRLTKERGITQIRGYYYRTPKNSMVAELYRTFGFTLAETHGDDTVWTLDTENYKNLQSIITIEH